MALFYTLWGHRTGREAAAKLRRGCKHRSPISQRRNAPAIRVQKRWEVLLHVLSPHSSCSVYCRLPGLRTMSGIYCSHDGRISSHSMIYIHFFCSISLKSENIHKLHRTVSCSPGSRGGKEERCKPGWDTAFLVWIVKEKWSQQGDRLCHLLPFLWSQPRFILEASKVREFKVQKCLSGLTYILPLSNKKKRGGGRNLSFTAKSPTWGIPVILWRWCFYSL